MLNTFTIDTIELRMVRLKLRTPFKTSGDSASTLHHILIKAQGTQLDGTCGTGWGEVTAPNDPYYIGETAESSWQVLTEFLVPQVLGKPWANVVEFIKLYERVKGNTFARAGLESAAWDLFATLRGESLAHALGGTRREIQSGVALGIESEHELLAAVGRYVEQGYKRIKLKIAPGADIATVQIVRSAYPKLPIMADANSAYTLADTEVLKELDRFDLMMIEQPLGADDFVDHAILQSRLKTPICLDESIRSLNDAKTAIALGSCRVMNIKAGRVGGLIEAALIHDACIAAKIPAWCGGMHEYGIGRAAAIALASLPGFSLPGDISGSDKYFAEDIVSPPIIARDGTIEVPTVPGNGFVPDEPMIADKTVRFRRFTTE